MCIRDRWRRCGCGRTHRSSRPRSSWPGESSATSWRSTPTSPSRSSSTLHTVSLTWPTEAEPCSTWASIRCTLPGCSSADPTPSRCSAGSPRPAQMPPLLCSGAMTRPPPQLRCATAAWTPGRATIAGTAGSISVEPWFLNPGRLVVTTSEGESRVDGEETAYGPQIEEVERCLRAGLLESPRVPHADTIAILELIDQARGDLGVRYPGEA